MRNESDELRVVHVLSALNVGGIELRLLDLARALPSRVRTTIVTVGHEEGTLTAEFKHAGVQVISVPMNQPKFATRFVRTLRALRPNAVHSHAYLGSGYFLALAWCARVSVRVAHFQSDGDSHVTFRRRIREAALRTLITLFATHILGVSDHALEAWRKRWRRSGRARVLTNGFDLASIVKRVHSTTFDENPDVVILHVGRADLRTKNRDRAVAIFGRFLAGVSGAQLVFVGRDGATPEQATTNRAELDELARSLGVENNVVYLGERSDVIELMATADALLFTSSREGVPGTVVEALAAGLPVLASDIPGCEFIRERVESRLTCMPLSSPDDEWAAALIDATSLGRESGGGSPLFGTEFDVERTAQELQLVWAGR